MRVRITPATVLAGAALFFALGGSALAVQQAVKPQARCNVGALRAALLVTGDPSAGIANFPSQFTSSKSLIPKQYNCGGRPQVRRVSAGVFEIRLPRNPATQGLVAATEGMAAVVYTNGVFRVTLYRPGQQDPPYDMGFTFVAV
jgi:hypothetical protein